MRSVAVSDVSVASVAGSEMTSYLAGAGVGAGIDGGAGSAAGAGAGAGDGVIAPDETPVAGTTWLEGTAGP